MAKICDFVFCLAMTAAKTQLSHFNIQSLSQSLGSVTLHADHSGRNAKGYQELTCILIPRPLLRPAVSSGLHLQHLSLLFSLPYSHWFWFAHTKMFWCTDLSEVFVCLAGNSLLNYSFLTCCNFKGRDQEDFSHCRASDVTPLHMSF